MPQLTDERRDRVARMRVDYGFEQLLRPSLDDGGDVAELWWVRVNESEQEDGTAGPPVAVMRIVRGVLGDPQLWEALDAMESSLETVASTILDPVSGELVDDLEELLEGLDERVLILNSVLVEPDWRGYGVGTLLAGLALQTLAPGSRLVATYPAPLTDSGGAEWETAVAKLEKVWGALGFVPFRDGVWVLDLATVDLDEAVIRLRKRFGVEV
jgi:GNAT superfamily N-acetyltransferase